MKARSSCFSRPFVAAGILCCLIVMIGIVASNLSPSGLVKETRNRGISERGEPSAEGVIAPSENAMSMTGEQAADLTELMRKLQERPDDSDVLREIGGVFIAAQDWTRAESFLGRAVLSRPSDIRPRYMLGITQYQRDKFEDAAKTFEDLLAIKEDPDAMYNLAVIYKYHSGKKTEAEALLRKITTFPGATPATVSKAHAEL